MSEHLTHYDPAVRAIIAAEVAKERERIAQAIHAEWFNGNIAGAVSDRLMAQLGVAQ